MVNFRVVQHSAKLGLEAVEILVDGKVAAVIYTEGANGIKLVSAHFKGVATDKPFTNFVIVDDGTRSMPPIPSFSFVFEPGPYKIEDGRIVRINQG